jgi:hypothetical protein
LAPGKSVSSYLKNKLKMQKGLGMWFVVEHLVEALSPNTSTAKKKKKEDENQASLIPFLDQVYHQVNKQQVTYSC